MCRGYQDPYEGYTSAASRGGYGGGRPDEYYAGRDPYEGANAGRDPYEGANVAAPAPVVPAANTRPVRTTTDQSYGSAYSSATPVSSAGAGAGAGTAAAFAAGGQAENGYAGYGNGRYEMQPMQASGGLQQFFSEVGPSVFFFLPFSNPVFI